MALGNESGDQVGSIHEKDQRSKISWDYPFKRSYHDIIFCFAVSQSLPHTAYIRITLKNKKYN